MTAMHDLTAVGYVDSLVLPAAGAADRPAIEWARGIFEAAPAALRAGLTPGWRALGLHLASRHAPDHVLGWPIVVDQPQEVVLGASSRLGVDTRLSIAVDDRVLRFDTAIRFVGAAARPVWTAVAPTHRLLVARLVQNAITRRG